LPALIVVVDRSRCRGSALARVQHNPWGRAAETIRGGRGGTQHRRGRFNCRQQHLLERRQGDAAARLSGRRGIATPTLRLAAARLSDGGGGILDAGMVKWDERVAAGLEVSGGGWLG